MQGQGDEGAATAEDNTVLYRPARRDPSPEQHPTTPSHHHGSKRVRLTEPFAELELDVPELWHY